MTSEAMREHARQVVASWPSFTEEQHARLARILREQSEQPETQEGSDAA